MPEDNSKKLTEHEVEIVHIKEDIIEIKTDVKTLITIPEKLDAALRKLHDHHVDLKVIKPKVEAHEKFVEALKDADCPGVKVTPQSMAEKAKQEKVAFYRFVSIMIAIIGVGATIFATIK